MKTVLSDSDLTPSEELDYMTEKGEFPECELELPSGYLSVSQVNTYMKCGLQYYYRYVKGIISPPQARMAEGSSVHRALEIGNREKLASGTTAPLDVLLDAHRDDWEERRTGIEVWDPDNPEKDILSRAQFFLKRYHQDHLPYLEPKPKGVESRFWASVGPQNVPVVGFIDLIATDYTPRERKKGEKKTVVPTDEVIDYKVVAKSMSQADVNNSLQLTMYSSVTQIENVRFDCFVKTKQPKISVVESTRKPIDHQWANHIFESTAKNIAAGVFMPTSPEGWQCTEKWCGYWHLCRGVGKK